MYKGLCLPSSSMVWMSPSRPEKWSACQCEMKILSIFIIPSFSFINVFWVPSPQSKSILSPWYSSKLAARPLSLVGTALDVPTVQTLITKYSAV